MAQPTRPPAGSGSRVKFRGTVLLSLSLLLASCSVVSPRSTAPPPGLPDTAQAPQCSGACAASYEECKEACGAWINLVTSICRTPCKHARRQCLAYCPGAEPTGS